jgi:hypothetical protein
MTTQEIRQVRNDLEQILLTHTTERHGGPSSLTFACQECQVVWRALSHYEIPTPAARLPVAAGGRRR